MARHPRKSRRNSRRFCAPFAIRYPRSRIASGATTNTLGLKVPPALVCSESQGLDIFDGAEETPASPKRSADPTDTSILVKEALR
jgi:hypothetical protein